MQAGLLCQLLLAETLGFAQGTHRFSQGYEVSILPHKATLAAPLCVALHTISVILSGGSGRAVQVLAPATIGLPDEEDDMATQNDAKRGRMDRPARTLVLGLVVVPFALLLGVGAIVSLISGWPRHEPPPVQHVVEMNSPLVSSESFLAEGLRWPLSVEGGVVGCTGPAAWFQAPDGTVYGVNGFATQEQGYADITSIWLEDEGANAAWERATGSRPRHPTRINIGDLLNRANAQCADRRQ